MRKKEILIHMQDQSTYSKKNEGFGGNKPDSSQYLGNYEVVRMYSG